MPNKTMSKIILFLAFIMGLVFWCYDSLSLGIVVILLVIVALLSLEIIQKHHVLVRLKYHKIADVEEGLVKVSGIISAQEIFKSYGTNIPCIYEKYEESKHRPRDGVERNRIEFSSERYAQDLFIKDDTGTIDLSLELLDIHVRNHHIKVDELSFSNHGYWQQQSQKEVDAVNMSVMEDHTEVVAIGTVNIVDGHKILSQQGHEPYFVIPLNQQTSLINSYRLVIGFWGLLCAAILLLILMISVPTIYQFWHEMLMVIMPNSWSYLLWKTVEEPIVTFAISLTIGIFGSLLSMALLVWIPYIGKVVMALCFAVLSVLPIFLIMFIIVISLSLNVGMIWLIALWLTIACMFYYLCRRVI